MKWISLLFFGAIPLGAVSVTVRNPSGELNTGQSPAPIADPAVVGWNSDGGQVIKGGIDYGNGGWRLSFEDSQQVGQMTEHVIQKGDSFSLRFDAAMFATGSSEDNLQIIGGGVRNGDFNADGSPIDQRPFEHTADWINLTGDQAMEATRNNLTTDGSRNAAIRDDGSRVFVNDTGHTLARGELFQVTYEWRDALNWNDAADKVAVTLFTTNDDTPTGTRTDIQTLLSNLSAADSSYQKEISNFAAISPSAEGKRLFVRFEGIDGNASEGAYARVDNFTLFRVNSFDPPVPVNPADRVIITDFYVDNDGSVETVATRSFPFKSLSVGSWDHYHMAVAPGSLDDHAGKTVGIRFRSNDLAFGNMQSFDNVRLDTWSAAASDGAFVSDWETTPDQVWAGPGYWANRLQDWRVSNRRVQCINGSRDRLTLHRPGTSIRGDGSDFTLSVRTGLNTGTSSAGSRAGFLLGAAPNVDWRGALLVHDGLGRDFGLFLGIGGDGKLLIEDYSTGATTALASASNVGFGQNTRLEMKAIFNSTPGTYTLQLTAFDATDRLIGTISVDVPSDRVLGAFGLLSHRGGNSATHWFDDFTGSGPALHTEPDRHLAILGAMHTLSRGTMKLTAQLSPLSLVGNPMVQLDVWKDNTWQQIDSAAIDNTDNLSSYTASFSVPNWDVAHDVDYRLRINIAGSEHAWTGTVRRDPVDKEEIVIAMTTCQRITDDSPNIQTDGFDWSPVMLWQPHSETYRHLAKHDPDVLLAHGDQIYESQPTSVDKSSAVNRQLDYLYKWNLWVLQVRELTREIPTVAIPDDHDVFQGNVWGEGGIATGNENTGGYTQPADWVRMVERTQTSNLPDPDPYNATQPPPPVAQGIGVYFTGMTYGRLGFAILEDRKFKTGRQNPPPPDQQHLLGERQHDFLRAWNEDWVGQDVKLVVSQSPLANLRTHSSTGYGFSLNDQDTHGWPAHRRNEAWELLRASRMFQLAGDQHLGSLAHHGVDAPRDAGISFTAPAMGNFWPRSFDPVHNRNGTTATVNPYIGDYYFDGRGTLPDGVTPNRIANDPHHFAVLAAANSKQYYQTSSGITPGNYHDRGTGYGIVRVNKTTRETTFECWPIHSDPDYPATGGQFADWPQTFRQTDNDGRVPTGYLMPIDTQSEGNAVIRVFDESDDSLVYAMRVRGNLFRPAVYDNTTTYRIEVSYGDGPVAEVFRDLTPISAAPASIDSFLAIQPSITMGSRSTLRWNVSSPSTLVIDQGLGDVLNLTVDGIGYLEVSPIEDTNYTLTLNGTETATTTVRVFPGKAEWLASHFNPGELADPAISGDDADPDLDGSDNDEEYRFQTDPRNPASSLGPSGKVVVDDDGLLRVDFASPYPIGATGYGLYVESSTDLGRWTRLPSNSFQETARDNYPSTGTSRITIRLNNTIPGSEAKLFYRAGWDTP